MTSRHLNEEENSVLLNEDEKEPFHATADQLGMEEYSGEPQDSGSDSDYSEVDLKAAVTKVQGLVIGKRIPVVVNATDL